MCKNKELTSLNYDIQKYYMKWVEDLKVKVKMTKCSGKACTNNSDTGVGERVLEYDTKIIYIAKTETLVRQR